jgi:hypothetical protein
VKKVAMDWRTTEEDAMDQDQRKSEEDTIVLRKAAAPNFRWFKRPDQVKLKRGMNTSVLIQLKRNNPLEYNRLKNPSMNTSVLIQLKRNNPLEYNRLKNPSIRRPWLTQITQDTISKRPLDGRAEAR